MNTWDDFERASLSNPLLYQAVLAVDDGRATREQALIVVAINLAEALEKTQDLVAAFLAQRNAL